MLKKYLVKKIFKYAKNKFAKLGEIMELDEKDAAVPLQCGCLSAVIEKAVTKTETAEEWARPTRETAMNKRAKETR